MIKIVFYALNNPQKHVFAKQKYPEEPKPSTPYTGLSIYVRMTRGTQFKNENLEFEESGGLDICTFIIQLFDAHLGKLSARPVRVVTEGLGSNFRKIFGKFSFDIIASV